MLLFIWLNIHLCIHELCEGSCVEGVVWGAVWGELWGEVCGGSCGGLLCQELRGELHGELCGGHLHQSPDGPGIHTPCLQYSQHKGDSLLPSHELPPVQLLHHCPHPQQQLGSPLQSVPTSPTACSSACAPSSSLSR